jgi:pilus assembly protein CpaE
LEISFFLYSSFMRAITICPSTKQRRQFEAALKSCPGVEICKSLEQCPEPEAFAKLVHAWVPEMVFLSIDAMGAEALNQALGAEFPGVRRIAIHSSENPETFRRVLHWRMQELVTLPTNREALERVLERIAKDIALNPPPSIPKGRVIAFVPAKAGAGASTIAANAGWALGEIPQTRVLAADFDSQSGMTGFLFNAQHEYGVDDAIGNGKLLDEEFWSRLIKPSGKNIDLLLSGPPRLGDADDPKQVPLLIDFARRHYTVVNADIPDSWDSVSLAVLREVDQILLVTTPELSSLRLARSKTALLRKLDLLDKAALILNRVSKNMEFTISEIESMVGLPVHASVPCDYRGVTKAIRDAKPAACMAESMRALADSILNRKRQAPRRHRFVEQFALAPLRFGFR